MRKRFAIQVMATCMVVVATSFAVLHVARADSSYRGMDQLVSGEVNNYAASIGGNFIGSEWDSSDRYIYGWSFIPHSKDHDGVTSPDTMCWRLIDSSLGTILATGTISVADFDYGEVNVYEMPTPYYYTPNNKPAITFRQTNDCSSTGLGIWFSGGSAAGAAYGEFFYSDNTLPTDTAGTRFISQTISTSTRIITVTGYITSSDLADGVDYVLNVSTPIYANWDSDTFIATSSGYFSWSSQYVGSFASTTIEQFSFVGTLTSQNDSCNDFFEGDCSFLFDRFATTTYPGVARPFNPAEIDQGIASNCKPYSDFWSLGLCLQYLLYPSSTQVDQNITDLRTEFLTRTPMGYVTRIYDIVNSSTTVDLPEIVMPIPGTSQSLDLTPWSLLFGEGSLLAQASSSVTVNGVTHGSGQTLRQITEPYWNFIWYVLLGFAILHDVIGVGRQNNGINKYGGVGDKPYGPQKP